MPDDFGTLRSDIKDAKSTLPEQAPSREPSFVIRKSDKFQQFLFQALDSLYEVCEDSSLRPDEDSDTIRDGIYASLQRIRRINSALNSDYISNEVNYFLEDVIDDLSIDVPVGLVAIDLSGEHRSNRTFKIYKLENSFNKIRVITLDSIWNEDVENSRVISIPRSELRNPVSYSVLVHECFHLKEDLIESVVDVINATDTDMDVSCMKEAAIDLLSLNYLGPVYADRLVEIPNKIGRHKDAEYPEYTKRLGYSIQYLDWVSDRDEEEILDTSVQQELQSIGHPDSKNKYKELERLTIDKLRENRPTSGDPFTSEDFQALQESIESLLSDIPTYSEERGNIAKYMGMPQAEPEQVSDKLDKLLIQRKKKVPIPIKPILILNFCILMKNSDNVYNHEPVLKSFKKWYVTDQTRQQLD